MPDHRLGPRGEMLIKSYERCRLKAYAATAAERADGIWTIGWGHTKGVTKGMTCTREQADAWFLEDVDPAARAVNALGVPLTQSMFDALVSLVFNCGAGCIRKESTIGRALRVGAYDHAADGFTLWVYQRGRRLPGLERRRREEQALFLADGFPS